MKTFTVERHLNDWNRYGERVNQRTQPMFTTTDPVAAAVALSTGFIYSGDKDNQNVSVVDETGALVQMHELYALVVGADVYAAQLADEAFSINLDHFFRDLSAARVAS